MSRWTNALLVVCAVVAFLLPLTGRWLLGTYQSLTSNLNMAAATVAPASTTNADTAASPVAQASWAQPQRIAVPSSPEKLVSPAPHAIDDLGKLAMKIAVATIAVLGLCIVSLQFGGAFIQRQPRGNSELQVCESLHLSKEASVKLIRVGDQKVVVTHDRQGVRGMVLLPNAFEAAVADSKRQASRRQQPEPADERDYLDDRDPFSVANLRRRLANSEEHGWDLNRRTS